MAAIKKGILQLSSGRQIRLEGGSVCIFQTLEVGEGFTRNILRFNADHQKDATVKPVSNPHNLTKDELMEMADYMIGLWMQLKDRVRQHNLNSPDIFKRNN